RYGFGEHGKVARGTRTAARHAAGRVRDGAAGCGAEQEGCAEGAAGASNRGSLAARNHGAEEAHVHIAVGAMAARAPIGSGRGATRARRSKAGGAGAGAAPGWTR